MLRDHLSHGRPSLDVTTGKLSESVSVKQEFLQSHVTSTLLRGFLFQTPQEAGSYSIHLSVSRLFSLA